MTGRAGDSLRVVTTRLEQGQAGSSLLDHAIDVASDRRFAFLRHGQGLVAHGESLRIPVGTGPSRFADVRRAFLDVASRSQVVDSVGVPGGGLIAFGSFTFDPADESSVFVVPAVLVGRMGDTTWRTTISSGDALPEDHSRTPPSETHGPADRPRYSGSTLTDTEWLEGVASAIDRIRANELEKVVLARDLSLWSRKPFVVQELLRSLESRFPSCFTFLVEGLVGASPERLVAVTGREVRSRVLAGTCRRGLTEAEDAELGAGLLRSAKDRWEHDLAKRSVVAALEPLCDRIDAPAEPSLIRLDNVQHLGSDVIGRLETDHHVLDVLATLHPTAAVGGSPTDRALSLIRELEGFDRARYSGPVGWCTPEGDGDFAIALRCAALDGSRARLFAGAGVVADSLPESELMETWLKFSTMRDVLDPRYRDLSDAQGEDGEAPPAPPRPPE